MLVKIPLESLPNYLYVFHIQLLIVDVQHHSNENHVHDQVGGHDHDDEWQNYQQTWRRWIWKISMWLRQLQLQLQLRLRRGTLVCSGCWRRYIDLCI